MDGKAADAPWHQSDAQNDEHADEKLIAGAADHIPGQLLDAPDHDGAHQGADGAVDAAQDGYRDGEDVPFGVEHVGRQI
jgi:hypothetical protein